ncbi:MAG: methylenetetrahydrofolate reductase [Pseudomonadota bacterium]
MELSVEFFPPKTPEGEARLLQTRERISAALKPAFYSVTFGAGGSTQSGTLQTVEAIHRAGELVAPHLSCVGSSKELITQLLSQYKALGIKRIVALRGDLPSGMGQYGELQHANQLVEFIRQQTGDWFHIEVAAYPETHPQAQSPSNPQAKILHTLLKKLRPVPTQRLPNTSLIAMRIFGLWTTLINWALTFLWLPALCQLQAVPNYSGFQMHAAQKFRAGFVCVFWLMAMTALQLRHLVRT